METTNPKVERFLRTGVGDFDALALELFQYQFELNKPYQAYCRSQDATPSTLRRWQDIPAVPIQAFKSTELATFLIGRSAAVFESSATTTGTPSRHYLKTLTYYETSLKTGFVRTILSDQAKLPFLLLVPSPGEAPRSSLTWMLDVAKRTWGGPGSEYFVQRGRLDEPRLFRQLKKAEASGQPVALLGTTIAFLSFFDELAKKDQKLRLSPGSRLMDTGGMKTQKREIARPEFVRQVGNLLGIPEDQCINEYGMCELGSQFYGRGATSQLQGPAWTRTLVIDPATGQPALTGHSGLLRHFDLANVDSVLAVQTEDIGQSTSDGFILLGRDPNADIKGCSLAAEALLTDGGPA